VHETEPRRAYRAIDTYRDSRRLFVWWVQDLSRVADRHVLQLKRRSGDGEVGLASVGCSSHSVCEPSVHVLDTFWLLCSHPTSFGRTLRILWLRSSSSSPYALLHRPSDWSSGAATSSWIHPSSHLCSPSVRFSGSRLTFDIRSTRIPARETTSEPPPSAALTRALP